MRKNKQIRKCTKENQLSIKQLSQILETTKIRPRLFKVALKEVCRQYDKS